MIREMETIGGDGEQMVAKRPRILQRLLQLVALAVPLCTQVIIDKVVVHQTDSTLIAIAVGLVMFMLFSAGMSWLRQADRARAGPTHAGIHHPLQPGAHRPVGAQARADHR